MQLGFQLLAGQAGFEQAESMRTLPLPDIRPLSDAELEVTFLRAALAWARWRERRNRAGR